MPVPFDNIEPILIRLGIEYTNKGNGQYLALCKFHNDTHPSMSISKTGLYHCWACGAKGNWYSLIKNITGENPYKFLGVKSERKADFSFLSALKQHKDRVQLNKKEENLPEFKIVAEILNPFEDEDSFAYCKKRNILKEDIDKYQVQYIKRGYINNTNFKNRLIIPIKNKNGNIISYEGRLVKGKGKKCVYPYRSKVGDTIFNLNNLDREKETVFVEGILDLIVASRALKNTQVSTFFGIQLSNEQIKIVNEFKKVSLMLDPDEAGQQRGNLIFAKVYKGDFDICQLTNYDPNESSYKEIQDAYKNRISITEFYLKQNNLLQKKVLEW